MLLSLRALEELQAEVVPHLHVLHAMLDSVSLLDLLCAFASLPSSTGKEYTRPQVNPAVVFWQRTRTRGPR